MLRLSCRKSAEWWRRSHSGNPRHRSVRNPTDGSRRRANLADMLHRLRVRRKYRSVPKRSASLAVVHAETSATLGKARRFFDNRREDLVGYDGRWAVQ